MQSSNGKSLVIGVASLVYALWGFEVYCCQRNEYLVDRNRKSIDWLFTYFKVGEKIKYNTIKNICQQHVNDEQEYQIQECYKQRLVNPKNWFLVKLVKKVIDKTEIETKQRRTILLFQDVQVLFDKHIYGKLFKQNVYIKNNDIIKLFDFIWEHKDTQLTAKKGKIKSINEKNDKNEFKKCSDLFNTEYEPLMDEVLNQIIFDLRQLGSVSYEIENNLIKFKNEFSNESARDFHYKNGYLTIWAYYKAYKFQKIDRETLNEKLQLLIKCCKLSYNEILNQFGLIAGVTSGLTSLSKTEKHYLQEFLNIKNFTVVPQIYEEQPTNWKLKKENRIKIVDQKQHFYEIRNQIIESSKTHPVIVVFQDEHSLNEFEKDRIYDMKHKINKLYKDANYQEKQEFILKAGEHDKVTLIVQEFAGGIDIQCNLDNGIHVIQTFFSQRQIQDLQMRNLTARQGNRGSYQMILNQNDLEINFAYDGTNPISNEKIHGYLKQLRLQKQEQRDQFDLEIILMNEKEHKESLVNLKRIKEKTESKDISAYLQSLNRGPNIQSAIYRTLILLEASECMQEYNLNQELYRIFPKLMNLLKQNHQNQVHQFKFAVYRNYQCKSDNQIYQSMLKWADKAEDVQEFLRQVKNEATAKIRKASIEVALLEAQQEIGRLKEKKQSQIQQIIIIGKNENYSPLDLESIQKTNNWQSTFKYKQFKPMHEVLPEVKNEKVAVSALQVGDISNTTDNFKWIADKSGVMQQLKDPKYLDELLLATLEETKTKAIAK